MKRSWSVAAAAVVVSLGGLFLWQSTTDRDATSSTNPPAPPIEPVAARPEVDLVFALDTTGSMGGLIEGAKAKIWEISRLAQEGKPAPTLRVGLVAYRDRGDAYVTQISDLTTDLDKVYATLTGFDAAGGGDGPEHVLAGLHAAIDSVHWSSDPKAVKIIYLVGDAPAHTDYDDGLTVESVVGEALQRGIHISAIRCGGDNATLDLWSRLATRTDGEVSSIESSGGVVATATPFDSELARLNAALAATEVHYGDDDERREAADVVRKNLAAPKAAQADRAGFYGSLGSAGKPGHSVKKDLVAEAPSASRLAAMAPAELPEEMKPMSADDRARFVAEKRKEREAILGHIRAENDKRADYLKSEAKPAPSAFDTKVVDSLRKAGARSGIAYK